MVDLSPLPPGLDAESDIVQELKAARLKATQALLNAEKAERTARNLRKTANQKIKAYEQKVAEYNGQLQLPY